MADMRVFVSSTCYDLSLLRSQLRTFIKSVGYEPVMSDHGDVIYDPRLHTHTSWLDTFILMSDSTFVCGNIST